MDITGLMRIKEKMSVFKEEHPKVYMFGGVALKTIEKGSVIDITVTNPDGKKLTTNMRVTENDKDIIDILRS